MELIFALFKADNPELARRLARIPAYGRARITDECAASERPKDLSLQVASAYDETTLLEAAGIKIGADLFARSRVDAIA